MRRSGRKVMGKLIGLVKPLTGYMLLAIFLGLCGHLCASYITILGGYAILSLLGFDVVLARGWIFFLLVFLAALRAGLRYGEQTCNHFIAFQLLALIRDKVFRVLRKLAPAKLEGRDKGDLIAVITSDIELLEVFYAHTISPAAIWAMFTLVLTLFIGSFHWILGVFALAAYLVLGLLIPSVVSKISGDSGQKYREHAGELSAFVLDNLRGLDEVLQYGSGEQRIRTMNEKSERLSEEEKKMKSVSGGNSAFTGAVILMFDIGMLFLSTSLYLRGLVGFEGVLIPTLAMFSSFGPSIALAALGSTLQNTFAAGNRVLDILEEQPLTEEISGNEPVGFEGAEAKRLTFAYPGNEEKVILNDFSLAIPKNRIIGIIGRSGSGKSTFLKLLMRFWKAEEEMIRISGRDISNVNTTNLRNMEGYVTQETVLFHDTIRNNLMLANPNVTEEELIAACQKASIHDFILTLPQGYDTQVGELGDTLSGGEQQRIGLARAFLHDAPLLLLDEPTSNLDSLNEAVILKSLHQERADKTIVLVSHRESTMRIVDEKYSIENGRMS